MDGPLLWGGSTANCNLQPLGRMEAALFARRWRRRGNLQFGVRYGDAHSAAVSMAHDGASGFNGASASLQVQPAGGSPPVLLDRRRRLHRLRGHYEQRQLAGRINNHQPARRNGFGGGVNLRSIVFSFGLTAIIYGLHNGEENK